MVEKEPSAKVYLYGSRVRGTAHSASDSDLRILLDMDKISPELEKETTYTLYDLEFDTGEVISPTVYLEKEWNTNIK